VSLYYIGNSKRERNS